MRDLFRNILVSSPNGGGLFLVRGDDVRRLDGIDTVGIDLRDGVFLRGEQPDRLWISGLKTLELSGQSFDDIHDVLWVDSTVYVVSTMGNQVVKLDRDGRELMRWAMPGEPDSRHLNCLAFWRGEVVVSSFGEFETHRGYKGRTRGAGIVQSLLTGKVLISGLSQPHSLVAVGERLLLASSEESELHEYDAQARLVRRKVLPGYTRGICVDGSVVYVGLSCSRSADVRGAEKAKVLALDAESWDVLGEVALPVNEIYSLMAFPDAGTLLDVVSRMGGHFAERAQQRLGVLAEQDHVSQDHIRTLVIERDTAVIQRDAALAERDIARFDKSQVVLERDAALVRKGRLFAERDQAYLERECAFAERDRANADSEMARAERVAAMGARDAAVAERDAAREEAAVLERDLRDARRLRHDYQRMMEAMQHSLSWRLTLPMRLFLRLLRHGLVGSDRQRVVDAVRRVYRRVPLPSFVRQRVTRYLHGRRRGHVLSVSPQQGLSSARLEQALQVREQQPGLPDYIVWSVIDWHFRHQRPQQLAQALAASGRRVFYISVLFVDSDAPGFEVEPLGDAGRLFNVRLFVKGAPVIYHAVPTVSHVRQLRQSIGELLAWADSGPVVSLVQHPFWLEVASVLPDGRMVYDCMDHHEGFGNVPPEMIALERGLLASADLTITTSSWLDEIVATKAASRTIIRNAGEFEHFARVPENIFRDPKGRRIIGYYGAIAEWFDIDLVAKIAVKFPDCCVLLIGDDTVNARASLGRYANVVFTGEVPYTELPRYLHAFDVCMLPFRIIPLTLATNPVKVYEYLSAGKPVVVVDLPEMVQFGDLVDVARDHDEYLAALEMRLACDSGPAEVAARQAFGRAQTWGHRAESLIGHAEGVGSDPRVSLIVLTYNNIELTKACLASIDLHSHYENLEIIVVDNASSDESPAFLAEWARQGNNRKLVLNEKNKGFAAGNNDGLAIATGDYLVLLNNDTYVTPGWVRTMVNHMRRNPNFGLLGPITNNIGNEARIEVSYQSMEEMLVLTAEYTRRRIGQVFPLRTAAFFCVMIPRQTYEAVGPLDEDFGRGFFEDDDYCRRVEQLGLRIACAEDVFVHHHLSASFNKLKSEERQRLFEENRRTYEAKWGAWVPHTYEKQAFQDPSMPVAEGAPSEVQPEVRAEVQAEPPAQAEVPPPALRYDAGSLVHAPVGARCNVCGNATQYFYDSYELWRESLTCEMCGTTSRYRSLARGLLQAIKELSGVEATSLQELPRHANRRLAVYDTQPSFRYRLCTYPLPDLLRNTGWIDVEMSQYRPELRTGIELAPGILNQNLERLTFPDRSLDIVITSDVMEHVRLDKLAHREIHRVLRPGGIYIFTVPHRRQMEQTLVRTEVVDPNDPSKDVHILEPEYHGDTNSRDGGGVLAYRVYGQDLDKDLDAIGFDVMYTRSDFPLEGIMNTELYYCRKRGKE